MGGRGHHHTTTTTTTTQKRKKKEEKKKKKDPPPPGPLPPACLFLCVCYALYCITRSSIVVSIWLRGRRVFLNKILRPMRIYLLQVLVYNIESMIIRVYMYIYLLTFFCILLFFFFPSSLPAGSPHRRSSGSLLTYTWGKNEQQQALVCHIFFSNLLHQMRLIAKPSPDHD